MTQVPETSFPWPVHLLLELCGTMPAAVKPTVDHPDLFRSHSRILAHTWEDSVYNEFQVSNVRCSARKATQMSSYLLDNAWERQRQRLAGLEAWFDPGTIRYLTALGVTAGWHCLEVGGGGGSIARWLSQQVGPTGNVVATDLDTRFLTALDKPNLDVRQHDITRDPLPEHAFELVHARFVLEHLADRAAALRSMVATLARGGWLLIEETDSASWLPVPEASTEAAVLFTRWTHAFITLCQSTGVDPYAGRRGAGELRALGLSAVDAEGRVYIVRGGTPPAEVWRLTAEQVGPRIIASGYLSEDEMAQVLALLADPSFAWMEGLVMATWGRNPE
jgi:SAM-dependent methyltransferase